MTLWTLAWRSLRHYRARSLATGLGVALAVASLVALVGLSRGLKDSLVAALDLRGTDIVVTEAGASDLVSSIIPAGLAQEFAARPGIAAAAAELMRMTSVGTAGSALVLAWDPDSYPWQELNLQAGRLPDDRDGAVAVIGSGFAARYGLSVGDRIELFQTDFTVIGEITSRSTLNRNLVFVPLGEVQRLTYRDGKATSLNLRLTPDLTEAAHAEILNQLRADWPDFAIDETEALAQGYVLTRIAQVLSTSISVVALVSASLMIFNTVSLSVTERRGEIAILTAVGWPRRQTVRGIVAEGVLLAGLAGMVGAAAGLAAAHGIARVPAVQGYLAPTIGAGLLAGAVALALFLGLVGALVPALRATAQSPARILRGR